MLLSYGGLARGQNRGIGRKNRVNCALESHAQNESHTLADRVTKSSLGGLFTTLSVSPDYL